MSNLVYQILVAISEVSWTIVYIIIIYRGFKDKSVGIPLAALALNISWECIFAFIFPPINPIQHIANIVWFAFNILIVYLKVRYGREEYRQNFKGLNLKLYYPTLVITFALAFTFVYLAKIEFNEVPLGMYSAFFINALMSILFILMLIRQNNVKGQSMYVAIFKMLGTACPTVLILLMSFPLVKFFGIVSFIFDLLYILMLYNNFKSKNLNPWTRKPLKREIKKENATIIAYKLNGLSH